MFGDISIGEIVVIVVVGLILFGPTKISEFAHQCGRAVNMFKKGLKEGYNEDVQTAKTTVAANGTLETAKTESLSHQS